MKVLAVDTATAWQSVAILDGEHVLAHQDQAASGTHATLLLPTIDRLLKVTGIAPSALDGLAVSIGPGSFTGLRVGLATMLGFRTITNLPLAVVPTLEGMAWNHRGAATPLCPVLNSRRGELYWALFHWENADRLVRLSAEQVGTPEILGRQLSGSVMLYGEGWQQEAGAIRASIPQGVILIESLPDQMKPSAISVGLAGLAKLQRGEYAGLGISPLYVQRPEAELRYEQSGGQSPVARRQEKVAQKLKSRTIRHQARTRPRS